MQEAKRRILVCLRTRQTTLDLSRLELSSLPRQALGYLSLQNLNVSHNQLISLSLTKLPTLQILNCGYNSNLASITLTHLPSLQHFDCSNCRIALFQIFSLPLLQTLNCTSSCLSALSLSSLPALKEVRCAGNRISELTLFDLPQLEILNCTFNRLSSLDLSDCCALKIIRCSSNKFRSLTISGLPYLQELDCSNNSSLMALHLSKLTSLRRLCCSDTALTKLDVSTLETLQEVVCTRSHINSLSLPKTNLHKLECSYTHLNTLHLSGFPFLKTLRCSGTSLTSLQLHDLPSLYSLFCTNTTLSSLSCCGLPSLHDLDCSTNSHLTFIDVSEVPELVSLRCSYNPLLTTLPESMWGLSQNCRIEISNCGFSQDEQHIIQERSRSANYEGPSIFLEEQPVPTLSANNLRILLQTLKTATTEQSLQQLDLTSLIAIDPFEQLLKDWLDKLLQSSDFTHPSTRSFVATRVLSVLQFAMQNIEYRQLAQVILETATGTCSDRATLGINQLELQMQFCQASSLSFKDVQILLRGSYVISLLEDISKNLVKKLTRRYQREIDEVEVYLALQVYLREEFSLPVSAQTMLFFTCSHLEEHDMKEAKKAVKKALAHPSKLIDYCMSQSLWKEKISQHYAKEYAEALAEVYAKQELLERKKSLQQINDHDYLQQFNQLKPEFEDKQESFVLHKTRQIFTQSSS